MNSIYMKIAEETINKATERNNRLFFNVGTVNNSAYCNEC